MGSELAQTCAIEVLEDFAPELGLSLLGPGENLHWRFWIRFLTVLSILSPDTRTVAGLYYMY